MIERNRPDLVLLDLMLPKMSGLEVLKSVRSQHSFQYLPILVFSASAAPGDAEEAWAAGATAVLSKTDTSPKQMLELVQQALVNESEPARAAGDSGGIQDRKEIGTALLLEPHADLRALMSLFLQRGGFRVEAVDTEDDVQSFLRNQQFDVFVLNAGCSASHTLVTELAATLVNPPILAFSTTATAGQRTALLSAGASLYIHAPEDFLRIGDSAANLLPRARTLG